MSVYSLNSYELMTIAGLKQIATGSSVNLQKYSWDNWELRKGTSPKTQLLIGCKALTSALKGVDAY